jgi:hypothetical protein
MNITVLFAVTLFLAAAFFVTYSEPNESDAADIINTWNCGPDGSSSVTATLSKEGVLTVSGTGYMDNYDVPDIGESMAPWHDGYMMDIMSVIVESGVKSIGDFAFVYSDLETVIIHDGVESIGAGVFGECDNLKFIEIPGTVKSIGDYAFAYSGLETVIIHDGVESIGGYAFGDCTDLKSIEMPGTVKSIGEEAFKRCDNLKSIEIPGTVKSIGKEAFAYSGLESVTIFNGMETIDYGAFLHCHSLKSIEIPSTVKSIGVGAFAYSGLETVTIPEGVESIGAWAFGECDNLESIEIPGTVKSIGDFAFSYSGLESVTIPNGVESIGDFAFAYSGLETVIIHDGVKSIGGYAFCDCIDLKSIEIPGTLRSIGDSAFIGCTDLISVTVTGKYTGADGTTGKYFGNRAEANWKLPGMSDAVKYLFLPDIYSSEYAPSNIAGAEGRELTYRGIKFTFNAESDWETDGYKVSLTRGTGISGFRYSIDDGPTVSVSELFYVPQGSSFVITAMPLIGYTFDRWSAGGQDSSVQNSKSNPLTVSEVTDNISLIASGYLIQHTVVFDYGSDCTIYVNGSPIPLSSSPLTVTYSGELTFTVNTPEGYSAHPSVISGTVDISLQADGRYRISDIRSDVLVNITAQTDGSIGSGSSNSNIIGSNGSDTDSGSNTSYLAPAVIVSVFLSGITAAAVAKFGLFGIKLFGK